jgi:hypothetical protein
VYVNVAGDSYWRYNVNRHPNVNVNKYPQPLSNWGNITGDLDDVLRIGNFAFFFRKGRYYHYNFFTRQVIESVMLGGTVGLHPRLYRVILNTSPITVIYFILQQFSRFL